MNKLLPTINLILFIAVLLLLECNTPNQIANGSSSETVIGRIANLDGTPACSTIITICPGSYNPLIDNELDISHSDTTDRFGSYLLNINGDYSNFTIMASQITEKTRALITDIRAGVNDTITAPDGILRKTGTVFINIPDSLRQKNGYVYIPGTSIFSLIKKDSTSVILDSVPAGIIPKIAYSSENRSSPLITRYNVNVKPADTTLIAYPQWPYAQRINLNTTPTGASVLGDVYNFPILIRLTNVNFDFTQADISGKDIRFLKSDNSFLPFEIERWDSKECRADIWVAMNTVFGNSNHQYIKMLWGNFDIRNESLNSLVFDTSKGFQGVWHLAENGNTTVYDATSNQYNGKPYYQTDSSSVPGVIGKAMSFDGKKSFITMHNTADSKLNFPENGFYSISLWACAFEIDSAWHGIASKGHHQYYLQYKCFDDTAASWEFVEFQNQTGWNFSEYRTQTTPKDKEWVYLTGIRDGNRQYLYVNGELVRDTALVNANETERNTDCDFTLGCHLRHDLLPDLEGLNYFNGKIDEVRVMNIIPDANWIKLCYMNQKIDDKLIEFLK